LTPLAVLKTLLQSTSMRLAVLCGLLLGLSYLPNLRWLAIIATILGGVEAVPSTWQTLRKRELDVEFLMLLSAVGSLLLDRPQESAVLMFLFSLSRALESFTLSRTKNAIESLVALRPSTVTIRTPEGQKSIPVEEVTIGDQIVVPPFQAFAVDGLVIEGEGSVDASALTGESRPVSVQAGSKVQAGVRNLDFGLVISAESTVANSTLSKVISLVEDAQENKASGERISGWFGSRYTWFVLVASIIMLSVKMALGMPFAQAAYASLTLLVALSPCALVISVPAATLSALAWAARNGLLIRGGEFIERAGEIKTVLLDKTGTLTRGRPVVTRVLTFGDLVREEAICAASSLESQSDHPVALAIIDEAKKQGCMGMEPSEVQVVPGKGIRGNVQESILEIGQITMFGQLLPTEVSAAVEQAFGKGESTTLLRVSNRDGLVKGHAVICLEDELRSTAAQNLQTIRSLGVTEISVVSGDTRGAVEAVAKRVGATRFFAETLPADKERIVAEAAAKAPTMMVGDGVNDAPALARASVGVAMGGLGSDIAMNAADVVLMNDRLELIATLIKLGRKTKAIVRANLIFGGAVIGVLTLGATLGILPLPLAVIGHEGSTLLVILNGLRLLGGVRSEP